jgi:23S rRNA (guanosine2251-2'-O)-methyltransferase
VTEDKGIIAGKNSVLEALKANRPINKIFLADSTIPAGVGNIIALARELQVPIKRVDRRKLDEMCKTAKHQGVAATVPPKEYMDLDQLVKQSFQASASPVLLMLDEVEDPRNLGAIIRNVEGLGAQGAIIPKHRAVPLTEGVNKASAGTLNYVPVARVTNLVQTLEYLKEKGFWVVGADAQAPELVWKVKLDGPLVVIIGGEDKGIGRLVRENCDYLVRLPMSGKINSLNASVAAGIMLYEISRQKLSGSI